MEDTMRASSDTIAHLTAAMAKAQSELVNPAKSLTAILERGRNGAGPQSYRYAPLSSGLDIVRKAFRKCELALIQTTHIEGERSLVLLTTTIAHSSGEWISGLWPVCNLCEIGHPKLMGTALSYARRYCLFTMVGIAGEDDLDAPDPPTTNVTEVTANGADPEPLGGRSDIDPAPSSYPESMGESATKDAEVSASKDWQRPGRRRRVARRTGPSPFAFMRSGDPESELARIVDAETLLRWAFEILPARNKLDDRKRDALDAAFLAKADAIGADPELLIPWAARRTQAPLPSDPVRSE
jgi:hypothetical protein